MLRALFLLCLILPSYLLAEEIRLFDKVTLKENQTYRLSQFATWNSTKSDKKEIDFDLSNLEVPVRYIKDGRLDRAEIQVLTRQLGGIDILGAEYVSVLIQPGFVLSESKIVEYASECMKSSLEPDVSISYINVNKLSDIAIDSPDPILRCNKSNVKLLGEKGVVFVEVITPKRQETAQVWFLVKVQTNVLVAKGDYKSGREISRGDFITQYAYVDNLNQIELLNDDSQQAWLLKKNITAGMVLQKNDIGELQDVIKGGTVNAMLRYKNLELIVQVKSENSGSIGDVIHVTSLTSMESFKAKIIGKNLVEVI